MRNPDRDSSAVSPRRQQDQRAAALIDAPLQSSPDVGDDECRVVADYPAERDEGGRAVSLPGSSVTSRESRRIPRSGGISKSRSRASFATVFSKRFKALRPCVTHPGLAPWDCLSYAVRSSLAGQERRIFEASRLLVSRVDLQLYQILREHEPQRIRSIFPRAPSWWPGEWGRVPICLPWEVSLYRGRLVEARENDAIWHELYQLFMQQLAAGWDLEWSGAEGNGMAHRLPRSLAGGIVAAGGFAFLPAYSDTLPKFISVHEIPESQCPPQRRARDDAWGVIRRSFEFERSSRDQRPTVSSPAPQAEIVNEERGESSDAFGSLKLAIQGAGLNELASDVMGGSAHLNLERPDVLCAFAAGSARVLQKVEKVRQKASDLLSSVTRDSDPEFFHIQLEQLAGSLPVVASHLSHWFQKSIEEIRSISEMVNRPVNRLLGSFTGRE